MHQRMLQQIRHHYEIERELSDKLRFASRAERLMLYPVVYKELYSRVPDIPHLATETSSNARLQQVEAMTGFLKGFIGQRAVFLEIGPGDFKLSEALSAHADRVYAVDVTDEVYRNLNVANQVEFRLSDGLRIPVPHESVDLAFSDQMIEHLHPEDAQQHLSNVYDALAPGGIYVCITPNRIYGPHDVSKYFDTVASGLHLKEYSVGELAAMFRKAGFRRVRSYTFFWCIRRLWIPVHLVGVLERVLESLPAPHCRGLGCSSAFKWLLRARVVGQK